ncbi:MAG: hypothetical protein WA324_26375 [Bryobacteraceae bacterium]
MLGFCFQPGEGFLAVNRLHAAAFQVVIAAVEHVAHIGKLIEIALDNILHKLVRRRAPVLYGEVFELLFRLGVEVDFHALQDTGKPPLRQGLAQVWGAREPFHFVSDVPKVIEGGLSMSFDGAVQCLECGPLSVRIGE